MKLRSLSQAVIILRQENEDLKSSLEATIEFEMKDAERYEASTPKSDWIEMVLEDDDLLDT